MIIKILITLEIMGLQIAFSFMQFFCVVRMFYYKQVSFIQSKAKLFSLWEKDLWHYIPAFQILTTEYELLDGCEAFSNRSFKRNNTQSSSFEKWAVCPLWSPCFWPCMPADHPGTTRLYLGDFALFSRLPATHLHDWHFDIALNEANKENLLKNQLTENLLNKGT